MELASITGILRADARSLIGCDGVTLVIREGDQCFYADEDSIAPLWRGQRFPLTECISGWAMLHDAEAVVPDIEHDPRIPIAAYRPTYVKSLVMMPIGNPAIAAMGAYWARKHTATPAQLNALRAFADDAYSLVAGAIDDAPWAPTFRGSEAPVH